MSSSGIFRPPTPVNEPVRSYAPGSPERAELQDRLRRMERERITVPLVIGGREVETGETFEAVMPHRKEHVLADVAKGGAGHVAQAIDAARDAHADWSRLPWEERAAVFLRAAELLAGPWRSTVVAATMLNQSKTAHQAEIDAACELIDFWRFNVEFMVRIYEEQPASSAGVWNRMEYRPLEGFVFAVSPFNFTAIGGNLSGSPALMGNTVVWKPASTAALSAYYVMRVFQEAGLPDGVINLVFGSGAEIGDAALGSPELAGIHFTGSTPVFQSMWKTVGNSIAAYRNYPRIVGETGGKDFILAHPSANVDEVATAIVRGSFEYQGQKCSASSRVYAPSNMWPELRERLAEQVGALSMGDVGDFSNFMGAVIDSSSFKTQKEAIDEARSAGADIVAGGGYDDSEGYFVEPTVIATEDPGFRTMREELFGPVVTTYVYDQKRWDETLKLVDETAPYGLTGAVFADDRAAIEQAHEALRYAAGNFYVNDKPTGAVVGQQPFGGARASGTNDKAGSMWNLIRWVSPRTIKETFVPPTDYRYPFMDPDGDGVAARDASH
ncbi:MAG: L-glutamate gamma-semialdehyde dehydrogenase [Actinobacteria bacterium]|nr:L-glutamate gamma-semialdehyde dehydrogenase [Actinomycetota bacterium]